MSSNETFANPYQLETRWLLQGGMLLFIYTVVIGILNGLDLVEFEKGYRLAHLHVGTLAWITGAVFAGALVLYTSGGNRSRLISWFAVATPLVAAGYNIAFLTTTNITRPIMGTLMLVLLLGFAVWGVQRARSTEMSVPHLGLLAGLLTSILGGLFGVLLGLRISNPDIGITESTGMAHPAAMIVGFLVPVGMAFAEWTLRPESVKTPASIAGWLQIGLPFVGGLLIVVGILSDFMPLIGVSMPCHILGLVIFLVRMAPTALKTSWLSVETARYGTVAGIFLVVNIVILMYFIITYVIPDDVDNVPRRLMLALDHSIFVGTLTMAIIPFIATQSVTRISALVEHVIFASMTLGTTGFVAGLLLDSDVLVRISTPILGFGLLFAILIHVRGMGHPGVALGRLVGK